MPASTASRSAARTTRFVPSVGTSRASAAPGPRARSPAYATRSATPGAARGLTWSVSASDTGTIRLSIS